MRCPHKKIVEISTNSCGYKIIKADFGVCEGEGGCPYFYHDSAGHERCNYPTGRSEQ